LLKHPDIIVIASCEVVFAKERFRGEVMGQIEESRLLNYSILPGSTE